MRVIFTSVDEVVEACNESASDLADRADTAVECGHGDVARHYWNRANAFKLVAKVAQRQIDKLSVAERS